MLAADGRFDQAQLLVDNMRQPVQSGDAVASSYSNAALPAAIAAVAHRKKEYRKVIDTLMPARFRLVQMGGSHAQREVFLLILADALQAEGEQVLLDKLSADLQAAGFADVMAHRITSPH